MGPRIRFARLIKHGGDHRIKLRVYFLYPSDGEFDKFLGLDFFFFD